MPIFIDTPDIHRMLVLDLLNRARDFLKLKSCNSVRLLLTCDLDPISGQCEHAHPSPILVRARISNVQSIEVADNPYCEFRIATAEAFEMSARAPFQNVQETILGFLDTQFHPHHWYHILRIHARMIMREPLGVLAVMEGSSDYGVHSRETHVLEFITDDKYLSEM